MIPWWTTEDDATLFDICGTISIREAAKQLGCSRQAVDRRLHRLGISWRQGRYGVRDIARDAGCGITAARRAIRLLLHDPPTYSSGGGMRYAIESDDADRIIAVLKRTQTPQISSFRKSQAGKTKRRKRYSRRCIVCNKPFWCVTRRRLICNDAECKRRRNTELTRKRRALAKTP